MRTCACDILAQPGVNCPLIITIVDDIPRQCTGVKIKLVFKNQVKMTVAPFRVLRL